MRIMIKGGVWKNTEDEILKAAVMKYGKNQWARISSLLVRKSAKQCKARWYEWLDPSIKKTEWTREEDEKLLHLARLMPTQWRTIAPIVGRTPSQCLERYEKLLDAACAKDENYEPSDDPRKLRPGEIDPNPESKPARPDPVDMDEDEKEMLSEARARLANTRGKKAKRKAREKQLEEARRLASLQKRRELKAAGIATRLRKRKRRGIDYNAEIPFEKRPPPGFFDTVDEERPAEQPRFPTTIEELEGRRRSDIEAQLRKQDIARNKIAERQDAPSAILQANKLNDPEAVRKRAKLMLPPPQISDNELEEIAKMGYASDLLTGSDDLAEGSGATRALLANNKQTPRLGMASLRTPQRTPGGNVDAVMMEAENLARLRQSQTPLLGGENPELHPSDFSGVTPKKREIRTPNPMATPLATPGSTGLTPRIGMTPRDAYSSSGMTPKGTPMRDELHINEEMDFQDNGKLELRRQSEIRRNLRSGLSSLPQATNEYHVHMRPIPEEVEEPVEKIEEDMSDRIAREKAEEQARHEALLKKRSKVLQRELPRPPIASLDILRNLLMRVGEDKSSFVPPTLVEQADELVNKEVLTLLEHDNAKYPLDERSDREKKKGGKRPSNSKSAVYVPAIEDFDEDELKDADSMIKGEIMHLRLAMGHENESFDDFVKARDACLEDLMYFPTRFTYGLASVAGTSEKLESLQNEFENLKKRLDDEAKKATKAEQKLKVLTHGYQTRAGKLWSQIEATFKQVDTSATELECFEALKKQEQVAALHRSNNLIEEVKKQRDLENTLQHRYGDLLKEHARVEQLVVEHRLLLRAQEIAARNRALQEEMEAKNRVLQEKARLEEEMALKEQVRLEEEIALKEKARLEEEIALKEKARLEEEIALKEIALKEDMALKEQAQLEEEIAPKEDMAQKEQAQFEEEIALKEDTTLKEQAQFEEELVPKEHGHLKEETMLKEHDHLKEEMMLRERAPVEEEMVPKNWAPVEEEMVPKDQAPVEEMVPKDQAPVDEEMVLKDRAPVEEVMAQKEQAPLEEESAHNVQASLVEKVIQEQPCSDEEMLQEEQHLEGEMVQEQTCLEEEAAQEPQKELLSKSRASKTVESRVDMEPKHIEISNIVGDSILCEEPMGSLAVVGGDPLALEPNRMRPLQDTSKTNVSVGGVIVDKSSSQPNEVTEDGHGNAAVSTAPATLAFKSDVIAKTEVFPIPPTSDSTDVSVKSGLDGQEAVPTTVKAVEAAEPEHTPISGLSSHVAEIESKTESIAAGTIAEPVQEIQKIDDVQGDCK